MDDCFWKEDGNLYCTVERLVSSKIPEQKSFFNNMEKAATNIEVHNTSDMVKSSFIVC